MSMIAQLNKTLATQLSNVMKTDDPDALSMEIARAKSVESLSKQIIASHHLVLDSIKLAHELGQDQLVVEENLLEVGYGGFEDDLKERRINEKSLK